MRPLTKALTAAAVTVTALSVTAGGCAGAEPAGGARDAQARDAGVEQLVEQQPGRAMTYSPTRETIRKWVETWEDPAAVSYVYLQNPEGDLIGYYVLQGLPVSYCASLTPPDYVEDRYEGDVVRSAPGVDGAYYSGAGCDTYYGFTADTGTYVEYTAGLGINVLLYDQPLPQTNNVPNLSPTAAEEDR